MTKAWSVFLAMLLAGLAFSCQQKPPVQDMRYEYFETYATPHARLALTPRKGSEDIYTFTYYDYAVESGKNLVFNLVYAQGDSAYEDNGVAESAVFEIPDTATSFHIRGREFLAHNGLRVKSCFCFDSRANKNFRIDSDNKVSGRLLTPFTWLIHSQIVGVIFTDTIDIRTKNVVNVLK